MLPRTASFVSAVLLVMVFSWPAMAEFNQWEPASGVSIREVSDIDWSRAHAGNDAGQTLIAWGEIQGGTDEVKALLFNADGEPAWDDPLTVASVPLAVGAIQIQPSTGDTWILVYESAVELYEGEISPDFYAQKISNDGEILWETGEQGQPVMVGVADKNHLQTSPDGSGGVFVFWQDSRTLHSDIFGQRLNSEGEPVWDAGGLQVTDITGNQMMDQKGPMVQPDGAGGCVLIWRDYRDVLQRGVYGQRINASGDLLWTTASEGGLPFFEDAYVLTGTTLLETDAGEFLILTSYNQSQGEPVVAKGQKIDADGNIMWAEGGMSLTLPEQDIYMDTAALVGDDRVVISGATHDFMFMDPQIYLQSILYSGDEPDPQWGDGEGILLTETDNTHMPCDLAGHADGSVTAVWMEYYRNETGPFVNVIRAAQVDASGTITWGEDNGMELGPENPLYDEPVLSTTSDDHTLVVWPHGLEDERLILLQAVSPDGVIEHPFGGTPLHGVLSGHVENYNSSLSGDALFSIWVDKRPLQRRLYLQKTDSDGEAIWDANGIEFPHPEGYEAGLSIESGLTIVPNSTGGAFIAWTQSAPDNLDATYVGAVDQDGAPSWASTAVQLE
ncbi:hypothetical protein GF324_12680, partial [bacterium]|nr:hypothetical protein [bacterium]